MTRGGVEEYAEAVRGRYRKGSGEGAVQEGGRYRKGSGEGAVQEGEPRGGGTGRGAVRGRYRKGSGEGAVQEGGRYRKGSGEGAVQEGEPRGGGTGRGAVRGRYRKGSREEKGRILDEFSRVTGYHRKTAVRLLSARHGRPPGGRRGRLRKYGGEVAMALKLVWEAADHLCSKRLNPFLPELVRVLHQHGELQVTPETANQVCQLSASTIDRLLRPYKAQGRRHSLSTTKPGSLLKAAIPIRTFADWKEDHPGFLEIDLVAHCRESAEGFYLNTLSTVDVATGWVECRGVWGKGQDRVGSAVHHVSQRLPFPLLGLDSDNGCEFINHHLFAYCQRKRITFTRSRPYKKNDSAHVEQKNWSVVRRLVGYDRYTSKPALEQLNRLYDYLRLYVNFFQPVMKLQHKTRHGARVHKVYDTAQTPYQRVLETRVLTPEQRETMSLQYQKLNPVQLLSHINQTLEQLWNLAEYPQHKQTSVTPIYDATMALR